MRGGLRWKFSRLRRMGAREIIFRAARHIGQVREKGRIGRGWVPKSSGPVTHQRSLLPPLNEYKFLWEQNYELDFAVLDDLVSGSHELFGHQKVTVSESIDWHQDPISGVRAPTSYGKDINYRDSELVGNVKVIWELGRQHHLVPLAVAYAMTGEERYLKVISNQLESWIDQNPFGMGIHWCSALELALRLVSWAMVHSLVVSRDGDLGLFSVVRKPEALGNAIFQQAWFVRHYLSRYSSADNHIFGELTGLWVASHVFYLGAEGEQWMEYAKEGLERELELQVFTDGVDKEQAMYYHLWMLEYALFLQATGQRVGSPYSERFCERTAAMAGFVCDMTPVGGKSPQIGDADDGFVTRFSAQWPKDPFRDVLDAEKLLMHGCAEMHLAEKAFWYGIIGGCNDALTHQRSCESVSRPYPRIYPEGGYAVLGNKHCHLIFDAGSLGYLSIAAHGHADALSFTLAIDGGWWLVDPGTYVYHSKPDWRDHFRSTRAHNCVVVDGRDQSHMSGPFMWSKHAIAHLIAHGDSVHRQWVKGCHNGYKGIGVIHCREIQLHTELQTIEITDELEGRGSHQFEIWFQCAPDIEVTQKDGMPICELRKQGSSRVVSFRLDADLEWEVIRGQEKPTKAGWYSARLGHRERSCVLRGHAEFMMPKRITTSIIYA